MCISGSVVEGAIRTLEGTTDLTDVEVEQVKCGVQRPVK